MTDGTPGRGRSARRIVSLALGGALIAGAIGVAPAAADGFYTLTFSTQPLGANFGGRPAVGEPNVPWGIQPVLSVTDDTGQPVFDFEGFVSLQIDQSSPSSGGPGSLSCSGGNTATFSGGQATFWGCSIDTPGEAYQLSAVASGVGGDPLMLPAPLFSTSLPFSIRGDVPPPYSNDIRFTTEPLGANIGGAVPSAPAGQAWAIQPVVSVVDQFGNIVTGNNSTVIQLSITPGTPNGSGYGRLTCASGTSLRVQSGSAAFYGCSIDTPGQAYQLTAQTYSTGSTQVLTDTSYIFNIGGGNLPARVKFTTQPAGALLGAAPPQVTSGTPWAVQPVVTVVNASGQRVASDYATVVSLSIDSSSQWAGTLFCAGGTSVTVAAGVANYFGCQIIGQTGIYYLRATGQTPQGAILYDISLPISIGQSASSLAMTASRYSLTVGGSVTFTATLAGNGAASQTLTFQRQQTGDAGWVTIGTAVTNAGGVASFTYAPVFNAKYQSTFAGSGSLQAATSDFDTIGVISRVVLSPGNKTVNRRTKVTYTATVTPNAGTHGTVTFLIYKKVSGTWVYQGSSTVLQNSAGKASYTRTWSSPGSFYVRARANDNTYYTASQSKISYVTVK
ncbi:MAG: Ig-like domain-containing protein [Chloroflexota bacterium]